MQENNVCDKPGTPDNPHRNETAEGQTARRTDSPREPYPGLFNDNMKERIGENEGYYAALLEQWRAANELTAHISEQRNSINNFYMSLLSLLIGGLLLSDQIASVALASRTVFLIVVLVLGICCCLNWIRQIDKCKRINYQKFVIIAELEKQLPANVLSYESKIDAGEPSEEKTAKSKAKGLSDYEKRLALVFCIAIASIVVIMLLEMWWTPLCSLIS